MQDDPRLAEAWTVALQAVAPVQFDDVEGRWHLASVNERIRTCRYLPGQQFRLHQDGVHHRGARMRSALTLLLYLDDGEAFDGGDTVFYAGGPDVAPRVIGRIRPRVGRLVLFDHALWHAGEVVQRGVKRVVRSDVLYRRDLGPREVVAAAPGAFEPAHCGYVWTLCRLADGGVASGGRDASIRLWTSEGRALATLQGHDRSVLGLAADASGRLYSGVGGARGRRCQVGGAGRFGSASHRHHGPKPNARMDEADRRWLSSA